MKNIMEDIELIPIKKNAVDSCDGCIFQNDGIGCILVESEIFAKYSVRKKGCTDEFGHEYIFAIKDRRQGIRLSGFIDISECSYKEFYDFKVKHDLECFNPNPKSEMTIFVQGEWPCWYTKEEFEKEYKIIAG